MHKAPNDQNTESEQAKKPKLHNEVSCRFIAAPDRRCGNRMLNRKQVTASNNAM